MVVKKYALCAGRHEIPNAVDGAIFEKIEDPTDLDSMWRTAIEKTTGVDHLDLYVTGLTVALVEFIMVCQERGCVTLTLWHYNKKTGDYYPQRVIC